MKHKPGYSKFNRILIYILIAICIFIFAGTIIAFVTHKAEPGKNLRTPQPVPQERELKSLNERSDRKLAAYTGIGTLRASAGSSGENSLPVAVVITPWFSYYEHDSAFYEELSRKRLLISGIITTYISEHTKTQLLQIGEEKIKAELLQLINAQLSLGKIENVFFTDYIFLE